MLRPVAELVGEVRVRCRCVTAREAFAELAADEGVMIDVREPEEVASKPSPAAVSIPRGVLEMVASTRYPDPALPIYLHCASGARATLAADQLMRLGYQRVSVVTCGIDEICACG